MKYCFNQYITSTKESTKITKNTQQKLLSENIIDKDYFCNKDNMNTFLEKVYPQFFEHFELYDFIKRGNQSYIYEGKYEHKKEIAFKFCIKRKRGEKEHNQEKKEKQHLKEISILKKLHHKNINEILVFYQINVDSYFSILELGYYGDLNNFLTNILKQKKLSETCINYLAKPILEALQYIHRCKIIHMDIKQGNILIDSKLSPKLIGFSATYSYTTFNPEELVEFPFIGTGKYMAPEIINRVHMKMKYGEKIELYSLGITLYTLAFGIFPFNLNDILDTQYESILQKIKYEKLEFPPKSGVSEKFKDFLSKILEKDYEKRINIKNALNHPWIQAHQILYDEKENIADNIIFLNKLMLNAFPKFNECIK